MDIKMLDKCQTRLNSGFKYPGKIIAEFIAEFIAANVMDGPDYNHGLKVGHKHEKDGSKVASYTYNEAYRESTFQCFPVNFTLYCF